MQVLRIVPTKSAVSLRFYLTRIMPIGLGMSLALLFGNLVYLQLSMSFIQMLKVSSRVRASIVFSLAYSEEHKCSADRGVHGGLSGYPGRSSNLAGVLRLL